MANKIIIFQGDDGKIVPVLAVDNGDGTYNLGVEATLSTGPITIGDVGVKGSVSGAVADVDAASKALLIKQVETVMIGAVVAIPVDGSGVTQPISAATLPLPAGAATEAKQDDQEVQLVGFNNIAGTTGDAAVVTDAAGTLSAKLRGLVKIFADIWDSVNHLFHTDALQAGS